MSKTIRPSNPQLRAAKVNASDVGRRPLGTLGPLPEQARRGSAKYQADPVAFLAEVREQVRDRQNSPASGAWLEGLAVYAEDLARSAGRIRPQERSEGAADLSPVVSRLLKALDETPGGLGDFKLPDFTFFPEPKDRFDPFLAARFDSDGDPRFPLDYKSDPLGSSAARKTEFLVLGDIKPAIAGSDLTGGRLRGGAISGYFEAPTAPPIGPREAPAEAAKRLAVLREQLESFLGSGAVQCRGSGQALSLYRAAEAVGIPLGQIRVQPVGQGFSEEFAAAARKSGLTGQVSLAELEALVSKAANSARLLVEFTPPERVGLLGSTPDGLAPSVDVAAYVAAQRGPLEEALPIPDSVARLMLDRLNAAGISYSSPEAAKGLIRQLVQSKTADAVEAFRGLALSQPELLPRIQRVLRNYSNEALVFSNEMTPIERANRIVSLLFAGDPGLRAVQVEAMRTSLEARSAEVSALIRGGTEAPTWDVFILGVMGPHGAAAVDRIAQTNPELRVLGADVSSQSNNFGRMGNTIYLNSRNGMDDGRPGGNGRGNINPVGSSGALLVSDTSGSSMPTPRGVDQVAITTVYEATQRSHLDVRLDRAVLKIEERSLSAEPDRERWPAAFRITFEDGSCCYSHKLGAANGFGNTPKTLGDAYSNSLMSTGLQEGGEYVRRYAEALSLAAQEGATQAPRLEATVLSVADALWAADLPGADVLAPYRVKPPSPLVPGGGVAGTVVMGFGDSSRTFLELMLGLAPDAAYRNTPAQLGQVRDLVWVVGEGGPGSCFEFLVGRDHLQKVLSPAAYEAFKKAMNDKSIEQAFSDPNLLEEVRTKLAPADQEALDGARTRYQKISGAILKGLIRLEPSDALSLSQASRDRVTLELTGGRALSCRRLIDGRGYQAELGPLAWLDNPQRPDPRAKLKDAKNLTLLRAPVEEGVIGRGEDGTAAVAKSFAGLENRFAWMGPGNGGDLVTKAEIAAKTKVGANTVSLFVNQPRTVASVDSVLGLGTTRVGTSITERNPPPLILGDFEPYAQRLQRETLVVPNADLPPLEVDADTRLAVQAKLATILQAINFPAPLSRTKTTNVDLAVSKLPASAARGAQSFLLTSKIISEETLRELSLALRADPRLLSAIGQLVQEPGTELAISGPLSKTISGRWRASAARTKVSLDYAPEPETPPSPVPANPPPSGDRAAALRALLESRSDAEVRRTPIGRPRLL